MFEKLIGISFVSAAADILLSGSSFKKYIKAVIGLMFVLTAVSGIYGVKDYDFDVFSKYENYKELSDYEELYEESLIKEVSLNTEKAIREKFFEENIEVSGMTIDFSEDFGIEKIKIYLKNYSKDKDNAINLLVNYYKIDKEVISICPG